MISLKLPPGKPPLFIRVIAWNSSSGGTTRKDGFRPMRLPAKLVWHAVGFKYLLVLVSRKTCRRLRAGWSTSR